MRMLRWIAGCTLLAGSLWLATTSSIDNEHASAGARNPLHSLVRDALDAQPISGRVEERLTAGSYTYLAVRTDDDARRWAVTLGRGAPTGSHVTVRSMGHSTQFYSPRLQRTFPELVFGIVSRTD